MLADATHMRAKNERPGAFIDDVCAVAFHGMSAVDNTCGIGVRVTHAKKHASVVKPCAYTPVAQPLEASNARGPVVIARLSRRRELVDGEGFDPSRIFSSSAFFPGSQKFVATQLCPVHGWLNAICREFGSDVKDVPIRSADDNHGLFRYFDGLP